MSLGSHRHYQFKLIKNNLRIAVKKYFRVYNICPMTFRGGLVAGLLNIGEQGMSQVRGWCYTRCLAIVIYWQVLPCLYIGSQKDAQDLGQISRFRISHVVSAHQGATKQFKVSDLYFSSNLSNPCRTSPTST